MRIMMNAKVGLTRKRAIVATETNVMLAKTTIEAEIDTMIEVTNAKWHRKNSRLTKTSGRAQGKSSLSN